MYHSISTGIFSHTGHCYHYPAQSTIFTRAQLSSRGSRLEMGRLNKNYIRQFQIKYDFVESATETVENSTLVQHLI